MKEHSLQSNSNKIVSINVPNSSRYYIFYASANAYDSNAAWTFKYALVDLSLAGGLGDVITHDLRTLFVLIIRCGIT